MTRRILDGDHEMMQLLIGDEDQLMNLTQYQKENKERFIRYTLKSLEQKMITETTARKLIIAANPKEGDWDKTFDLYEQLFQDLAHCIVNKDYYAMAERVERGQSFVANEKNEDKREFYKNALNDITDKFSQMEVIQ